MLRNLRLAARVIPRRAAFPIAARSFLATPCRLYSSETAAQSELVASLRSELKIETENAEETKTSDEEYFNGFLSSNGFKLVATPGNEEVCLVRETDADTIKVFFNISDTIAEPFEEETIDEEEVEDFDTPVRLNIVVERKAGAVGIEALVQDNAIIVESVTPYSDATLATDESPEADYKRRQVYQGPAFSMLDPSVQGALQGYLESRKIDSDLALFISEFSAYRENQEYISWLNKLAELFE